jgi:reductive dehalogenase
MTAFRRRRWDPSFPRPKENEKERLEDAVEAEQISGAPTDKPGYRRSDYAFQAAAWTLASSFGRSAYCAQRPEGTRGAKFDDLPPCQTGDEKAFTLYVKNAARLFGASLVGITRLNPLWLYDNEGEDDAQELPPEIDTAVVMAIEMNYHYIATSPSVQATAATGNGYSRMVFTACCLAEFLRNLGFKAIACGNDTALSIALAIDAGLGELGRNGLLITEKYGPRVRLCKVLTNAPLVLDEPIQFGVRKFCEVCKKCATTCPPGAITEGEMTSEGVCKSNNPGILKWYVNVEKCLNFWHHNRTSCSNCIRSCPFNKPEHLIHDAARIFIRANNALLDWALVKIDDAMGYGKQKETEDLK